MSTGDFCRYSQISRFVAELKTCVTFILLTFCCYLYIFLGVSSCDLKCSFKSDHPCHVMWLCCLYIHNAITTTSDCVRVTLKTRIAPECCLTVLAFMPLLYLFFCERNVSIVIGNHICCLVKRISSPFLGSFSA